MPSTTKADHAAILRDSADLIDRGFTQGSHAKDAIGRIVRPDNQHACFWCAVGAIDAATACHIYDYDVQQQTVSDLIKTVVLLGGLPSKVGKSARRSSRLVLMAWNDAEDRKPEEVSKLLRDVADAVEKKDA